MASASEINSNSNEEYEPLDTMKMKVCSKNGVQTTVSAIHVGFMETKYYVQFKILPVVDDINLDDTLDAEEEECLEYMMFLEEDLHWVLKLPHNRFWSQVVYDENLHCCLESYLSQAPRPHEIVNLKIKDELLSALKKIHKLVFLFYLRMSTYKESKKHHIRPEAFGDIIYDNFLFDIPKIMDLCALYGIQNSTILTKMIFNIFSTQPKYRDDLDKAVKVILTVFSNIEEKLLNISSKQGGSQNSAINADAIQNELTQYQDVINYIADVCFTIHVFLETYPPACQIFNQNGMVLRIPTFYEQVFSFIEKEVAGKMKSLGSESDYEDFKRKVSLSKTSLLRIFRNILDYTCIQNILDAKVSSKDRDESRCPAAENFLDILMESSLNKGFLKDYNLLYPFENDLQLFNEIGVNLDSDRLNYVFCSIHDSDETSAQQFTSSVANGARPKTKIHQDTEHKSVKSLQGLADTLRERKLNDSRIISPEIEIFKPNEIEMNSLIQSVQDTLQVGEGFIEKCLEFYSFNPEKVIDAILTESLPDHLKDVDRNLQRDNRISCEKYPASSERKNIFDNDELSSNAIRLENIHIGKKNKTPNTYKTLEESNESELIKQRTLAYGSEETELELNLYEDEYDDTYDSTMVGLKEPPLEDEPDPSDEEPEDSDGTRPNHNDFCINPEILRERAEQRWQAKRGSGRNFRGGGNSTDQARGFQQKDRNKAYAGNHNRRKQSDFKRSRGMGAFPTR